MNKYLTYKMAGISSRRRLCAYGLNMMREKITKSFRGRLLLISIIGLVVCSLSCYIVAVITIHSIERNQMENSLRMNMKNEMAHLEFCYFTMSRMMQQLGEEGNIGAMLEDYLAADNNFDKFQRRRELENAMLSASAINTYVNFSVYIDSETREEFFGSGVFDGRSVAGEGCMTQIGENQFQVLHRSNSKYNDSVVVSMLREKQHFWDQTLDIYIEMKSNIEDYVPGGDSFLSIQLDQNGKVLFSNSGRFAVGDVLQLAFQEDGSFSGRFQGYYLIAEKSEMGFIYVNGVPQEEYVREIIGWYEKIFLMCVLSILPALLIVYATTQMLGKPIRRLGQAIVEVGEGKLDMDGEDLEVREFQELMYKINDMKADIKNLLVKVQMEEKQRQKTEREKLMYQINPHFLLNTLNSVQWMAQMAHQESISSFLADFKFLLAYNLGKEEKKSTLRSEVEIARRYINLQKQRYDFEVHMDVEEGQYLETETIRMLFQPLIENAIRYGLGDIGVVDVRIFHDVRNNYAVITIQDYGNGLCREKLEQLNRPFFYEDNGEGDTAGIGRRYVRHCLEGFYQGKAILAINSEIGRGTKVTIIIPVQCG